MTSTEPERVLPDEALWQDPIPDGDKLPDEAYASLDQLSFADIVAHGEVQSEVLATTMRRFAALHYLIRQTRRDGVGFRREYRAAIAAALERVKAPGELQEVVWGYYERLGVYDKPEELEAVKEEARAVCAKLGAQQPRERVADSELTADERAKMNTDFREVEAAGRSVFLEPAFAEDMLSSWTEPLLTNTAHAVETLHMLTRREARIAREWLESTSTDGSGVQPAATVRYRVNPAILKFVASWFDAQLGLFREPQSQQDLYATSSAIAVFKANLDLECTERANAEQLERLFVEGPEQSTRISHRDIRAAALRRLDTLLQRGPHGGDRNTMVEINHALRIIWNLSPASEGGVQAVVKEHREALRSFLLDCHRRTESSPPHDQEPSYEAFVMTPNSSAPCMTACLAAFRIAQHVGLDDPELQGRLARCGAFVRACESADGGYGSSIRHTPDLLHTYMAISLTDAARHKIESRHPQWQAHAQAWAYLNDQARTNLMRFLAACAKRGGYSLVPEWRPNAYATRLGFQILTRLKQPIVNATEMRGFIEGLLIERDGTAGYAGHQVPRVHAA